MFPFQIASSQAANQKSSGFCVVRFQADFDEREHFVLLSLYRNIAFIWSVKCAQTSPSHQSLHHLLISLRSELKAATASGNASLYDAWCMALATRCWETWVQQRLRRSFRLSIPWIFTTHQPLQFSPDEEVHVMSRLFGGQASDLRYRRQTWSRYSADCCLIARQPAGTGEALADRQWCDRNLSCSVFVLFFFFRRKCSREQSRACKGYSLKCDKGMANHIFSFDEIWTHKNLTAFWFAPCDDAIWKGSRVWIHSFERKLCALSNAVSGKVVRRIGRELFDLKARGDIFFNHPVY